MIWSITFRARLTGNREADALLPLDPPVQDRGVDADQFAVRSIIAPPELPGLIGASVWMKSS